MILLLALLQFYAMTDRRPSVILEGTWASCPDRDTYTELAYEYRASERGSFELHLGPRDSFAIFAAPIPEAHIEHDDARNLLLPAYHYADVPTKFGGRNWSLASLGVHLNVVQLHVSFDDCYMYAIKLEKATPPTWIK